MRPTDLILHTARVWLAALAAASQLSATPLYLPNELPLAALPLTIELSNAQLQIVVSTVPGHVLRARVVAPNPDAGHEPAALDVTLENDRLSIRRVEETGAEHPRLDIDLVVATGQPLRLAGSDLEIRVEDPIPRAELDAPPRSNTTVLSPAAFNFTLDSSQADLIGVHSPVLDLTASSLWLDGTTGAISLNVLGGSVEAVGHRGRMNLEAVDADVLLAGLEGHLTTRFIGGRLEIQNSRGSCQGTTHDAALIFGNWQGKVELVSDSTTLEARSDQEATSQWQLEGQSLQVFLERIQGAITADLEGGILQGDELRAKLTVTATGGTQLTVAGSQRHVELRLTDGVRARVSDAEGGLDTAVADSRLEVDGINRWVLTGARAEVVASRVAWLPPLQISDSELELDLRETQNYPKLKLLGSGRTRIQLSTPCIVRIAGPETQVDSQVEVTSCELRLPGQRVSQRQEHLKYGADSPARLTVTLDPDVELEVSGEP